MPLTAVRPGAQGGLVFYTQTIPEKYAMPLPAEGWHVNAFLLDAMRMVNQALEVFTAFKDDPMGASENAAYRQFYDEIVTS